MTLWICINLYRAISQRALTFPRGCKPCLDEFPCPHLPAGSEEEESPGSHQGPTAPHLDSAHSGFHGDIINVVIVLFSFITKFFSIRPFPLEQAKGLHFPHPTAADLHLSVQNRTQNTAAEPVSTAAPSTLGPSPSLLSGLQTATCCQASQWLLQPGPIHWAAWEPQDLTSCPTLSSLALLLFNSL